MNNSELAEMQEELNRVKSELARYKNVEIEDRVIHLPHNVGDEVFYFPKKGNDISQLKIMEIVAIEIHRGNSLRFKLEDVTRRGSEKETFYESDFGVKLFDTREEFEKKTGVKMRLKLKEPIKYVIRLSIIGIDNYPVYLTGITVEFVADDVIDQVSANWRVKYTDILLNASLFASYKDAEKYINQLKDTVSFSEFTDIEIVPLDQCIGGKG